MKIAITGGIGSGKSSFADYLSRKGYPLLKADEISKEILASDKNVAKKIIQKFGRESFVDGKPDKKYLAEKVFSSPDNVLLINSILHPTVIKRLQEEIEKCLRENDLVFVEAALVYEADIEKMFDYVVLITASEDLKYERKVTKENLSPEDYQNRKMNQIPDEEKKKRADFVFENNGTKQQLYDKAELLLLMLKNL